MRCLYSILFWFSLQILPLVRHLIVLQSTVNQKRRRLELLIFPFNVNVGCLLSGSTLWNDFSANQRGESSLILIRGANDQMNLHWTRIPFGHLKSTQVVRLNRFELRGNILNTRRELPSLDIEVFLWWTAIGTVCMI